MHFSRISLAASVAALTFLAGCATDGGPSQAKPFDPAQQLVRDAASDPGQVRMHDRPMIMAEPIIRERGAWLEKVRVSFSEPSGPIPVSQLVRSIRDQSGINITSQLPLGDYVYSGYGLDDVDGKTAMDVVFGSVGLDYQVKDKERVVQIVPVSSETWMLNIGPRETSFSSSAQSGSEAGTAGSGSSGGDGGIDGVVSTSANNSSDTESSTTQNENFWTSLEEELTERLTYLVPVKKASQGGSASFFPPGRVPSGSLATSQLDIPSASGGAGGQNESKLFDEVKVGRLAINPVNGSVTVQAPKHVLKTISEYMERIEAAYNTMLEFEGRLILVNRTDSSSQGIDLSAFRSFASGKYGFIFRNNALDGLTVSAPPNFSASSASTISSNLLGVINSDQINPLSVFLAFLESQGEIMSVQRPTLSTTSGVPVTTSEFNRTYVNIVSEESQAAGLGGAATSRKNTLVPFEFGTSLRISPRFDPEKNQIRALISLTQVLQAGSITIDQFVSGSGGAAVPISTQIPLDRRIEYQGEALLRDGDLIILGGQSIDRMQQNSSGITGMGDVPLLGQLFGKKSNDSSESIYYFALQVKTRQL